MALLQAKKDEIYGYETLYREIGYYITRLEQYERALKWFDEAIQRTPNDKRALMGRSMARAKACQYEGALVDIQKALDLNPGDLTILAHKALNTFLSCEFEKALVINGKMSAVRRKPDYFVLGAMDCKQAINSSVGPASGHPLRDHFLIIRRLAWRWNYEAQKPYRPKPRFQRKKTKPKKNVEPVFGGQNVRKKLLKHIEKEKKNKNQIVLEEDLEGGMRESLHSHKKDHLIIPPYDKPYKYRPLQKYTTNIENYLAEKYLNSMYLDKLFLKRLKSDTRITNPNKKGEAELLRLSRVGFHTVNYKQELLRARRPFYYIKYHETRSSDKHTFEESALIKKRQLIKTKADGLLQKMQEAVEKKQLQMALNFGERLYDHCTKNHIRFIPDRKYYLDQINDNICNAYFDIHRLNDELTDQDQEACILVVFGQSVDREPSKDSVLDELKDVHIDYKKMVQEYKMRLINTVESKEMALLNYELSKCHLALRHFELSRVYARKCIAEAKKANNVKWLINGLMMLTKISVVHHNKNDAKTQLVKALDLAQNQNMSNLVRYIQMCIRVVDHLEFDDTLPSKVIEKREEAIQKLMPERKMRDEVSHLFHMIDMMPPQRRLMVIPGIRIGELTQDPGKKNIANQRPTISPLRANMMEKEKPVDLSMMESSDWRKGIGFLDLIQNHIG